MSPRYTFNSSYTLTDRESYCIINALPGSRDILRNLLLLNDPENMDEPPLEFWDDLRGFLIREICDGSLRTREDGTYQRSFERESVDPMNLVSYPPKQLPQFSQTVGHSHNIAYSIASELNGKFRLAVNRLSARAHCLQSTLILRCRQYCCMSDIGLTCCHRIPAYSHPSP